MDLMRLQFVDITAELNKLQAGSDPTKVAFQSERIRQWIHSLNRSSYISLNFRLKYLKKTEEYLDVISEDMGGIIMLAYKTSIMHLKNKAAKKTSLYGEMVHVTSIALELAVRNVIRCFVTHSAPTILDTRQTFEMARLGLVIAKTLDEDTYKDDIRRLKCTMIQHELLRRIDMFSLTVAQQKTICKRILDFTVYADIEFLRTGDSPSKADLGPFLVSLLNEPQSKTKLSNKIFHIVSANSFIIYAGEMFRKARESINASDNITVLSLDTPGLHLEEDAKSHALCGNLILSTFKGVERNVRQNLKNSNLSVPARKALALPKENIRLPYQDWFVVNISNSGVRLEGRNQPSFPVNSLIETKLASSTRYGLVRWLKSTSNDTVECGVEYISTKVVPAKVTLLSFSTSKSHDKHWFALLEKVASGWNVWLGDWHGVPVPISVTIQQKNKTRAICRLVPTGEAGSNYAIFQVAEVMAE